MNLLDTLYLVSVFTVLMMAVCGRLSFSGWLNTVLLSVQLIILIQLSHTGYSRDVIQASFGFTVLGLEMSWRFDALSWFFSVITVGAALLASWYSSGAWGKKFREQGGRFGLLQFALAANVFCMLILLGSGDLLALFIGWELVSWASFLMMCLAGGTAVYTAWRYITYAMGGAMAILAAMVMIFQVAGSFHYADFVAVLPTLSHTQLWLLVALFGAGFAVKMGLLPFHLWQAKAYALTPAPGAAFLGAISSRMGLYTIVVVLIQLISMARINQLHIPWTFLDGQTLIAWIAAFTIIVPTFTALRQNDARMLLAWHGIGQGGYMLMGIALSDSLGSAGGLMHVFNHATYQAALMMSVFAVRFQTGTSDLNKLGGLITRMPISFLVMLVGIIGLAGMPPMNGFVSKWMVYRALIDEGMPLLFVAAIIGTLGTILSVYKLIHNMYLGQLRLEHQYVREVPWSMVIPMGVLASLVLVTGVVPGLVLAPISSVQAVLGLPVIHYMAGGVEMASGMLDMIWVTGILFGGFAVGAVLFYSTGRTQHIHQLDNYAGGHFLSATTHYQYSDNFYAGLMRVIGPLYRYSFQWLENSICSVTGFMASGMRLIYANTQPSFYILASSALLMMWIVL